MRLFPCRPRPSVKDFSRFTLFVDAQKGKRVPFCLRACRVGIHPSSQPLIDALVSWAGYLLGWCSLVPWVGIRSKCIGFVLSELRELLVARSADWPATALSSRHKGPIYQSNYRLVPVGFARPLNDPKVGRTWPGYMGTDLVGSSRRVPKRSKCISLLRSLAGRCRLLIY